MADLSILPQLTNWFAQDPLFCVGIVACLCATIHGLFNLDRQGEAGLDWFSGDSDGDGGCGDWSFPGCRRPSPFFRSLAFA